MSGIDPNIGRHIEFLAGTKRYTGRIVKPEEDGHGYLVEAYWPGRRSVFGKFGHVLERNGEWGTGLEMHRKCSPPCIIQRSHKSEKAIDAAIQRPTKSR